MKQYSEVYYYIRKYNKGDNFKSFQKILKISVAILKSRVSGWLLILQPPQTVFLISSTVYFQSLF